MLWATLSDVVPKLSLKRRELTWRVSQPSMTNSGSCLVLSHINSIDPYPQNRLWASCQEDYGSTAGATTQASLPKCTDVIGSSVEATQSLPRMDTQLELCNSTGPRHFSKAVWDHYLLFLQGYRLGDIH